MKEQNTNVDQIETQKINKNGLEKEVKIIDKNNPFR